ncbi:PH domain-containing protein [Streptomyces sp. NBC_00264]|uniref:PH domain-containing protein n=1 Tax=unclassified Streptomyces TaxID=2593676 RepID=UPI001F155563|nr:MULTISPECIES: PH domain-containing protein [unclassified Streptomyces]MCX5166286.1 PH domain-containing protein [Streptomyces sp. NBC_00305]MCX5224803.1 PH domain-containing protein [Streptomyces sp. NBC_00264]WSX06315.1 PH domain-containing protein [Streptomyces sp. NBC_00987]
MPLQTRIQLDADERNRYSWRAGFVVLTFIGMSVAAGLTTPAAERWWWIGGIVVFSCLVLLSMVNQATGATLLTPRGMEFRTVFSRRVVPWGEVVSVEKRYRTGRNGTWSYVRVRRAHGRALTLPGIFTARWNDPKFEAKLAAIRQYLARVNNA